ncbi:MAG: 30S ribosomal protein S12 methylthiotransferase RimO [Coriobacteriales bacterium]|nr:30S ribosomal protein S12 methylthiotransferase RimO [Coriobacteriales bacterium]
MACQRVGFLTLGCAKNEADTRAMVRSVNEAGFDTCFCELGYGEYDVIVINTCAFLQSAVNESIDTILSCAKECEELTATAKYKKSKIIVCGCLPSRYGEDLYDSFPEVSAFLPVDQEEKLVETIYRVLGEKKILKQEDATNYIYIENAYVKISDGCNRFCSYCMIPYIRGAYRSLGLKEIDEEVTRLINYGEKEIVFVAQDTGIWGSDFKNQNNDEPSDLPGLLEYFANKFPDIWFRVLYIQPQSITDELLSVMAKYNNICSYLDIPMQHANTDILKAMNRTGGAEEYKALIKHIREVVPHVAIRSTFMCGFPGETEEQFEELCEFLEEIEIDFAGTFAFSPEDQTAAFNMPNQIDDATKLERQQRLNDLCEQIGFAQNEKWIGQIVDAQITGFSMLDDPVDYATSSDTGDCCQMSSLSCSTSKKQFEFIARGQFQAPEVDGEIHIVGSENPDIDFEKIDPYNDGISPDQLGFVRVKITNSFCYELEGVIV